MIGRWLTAGIALVATPGCDAQKPELSSYRYRLKVDVLTPEGVRTASSVIEVKAYKQGPIPSEMTVLRARGVGPVVDLGPRGKLFVLLSSPNSYEWAETIMIEVAHDQLPIYRNKPSGWKPAPPKPVNMPRYLRPTAVTRGKLTSGYPYLVRFRDPSDWGSMEIVDPDDLAASFGKYVRLLRLTGEVTDDPVSDQPSRFSPRPYKRITEEDLATMRAGGSIDRTKTLSADYFYRGFEGGRSE